MQWSDISLRPSPRTLRQFAALWLAWGAGLAAWLGLVHQESALALLLALLGLAIGGGGLVKPALVRWLYVGAMVLAFPIGWTVSLLVLAVLYYGILTPLALCFRLGGRDVLRLRRPPTATSYWNVRPAVTDLRGYYRQF
jgi:hypothetical protein